MEKVLQNARYGSPRYRKGEKYCPTCRLVYSAEYANGHCEKCGGALRMNPKFQRTIELSDYDKALLQWLENTYGPGFALRRHALYSIGERRCRTCQLVHPPSYPESICAVCRMPLAYKPRKARVY